MMLFITWGSRSQEWERLSGEHRLDHDPRDATPGTGDLEMIFSFSIIGDSTEAGMLSYLFLCTKVGEVQEG